jgi:two-component system chemotaxis sensor kinase CheA
MVTAEPHTSLRRKFIQASLASVGVVAAVALLAVTVSLINASSSSLQTIQADIQQSLQGKGQLLVQSHAQALRGLAADNAFGDVTSLVLRAVEDDADVVYGHYQANHGPSWVYVSPSTAGRSDIAKVSELGLTSDDAPAGVTAHEVSLFGDRILDIAAPVVVDGETLGTIRYGLSKRAMISALDDARTRSSASLRSSLLLILAAVVAAGGGSALIALRLARSVTGPLEEIAAAAQKLAAGDRSVSVQIKSGDEVEILGGTFNRMVADLDSSYRSLETLNRTLEQRVADRTAELSQRNTEMRRVLDNVEQGFMTLDELGIMASERSAVVDGWFGAPRPGELFASFLGRSDDELGRRFVMAFEQVLEGFLPLDVSVAQLPGKARIGARHLEIRYLPAQSADGHFAGLGVVVTDITERVALEESQAAQREAMEIFTRLARDRAGFRALLKEAAALVGAVRGTRSLDDDDIVVLKREVHTLKGVAMLSGLGRIAELCHRIEDALPEAAPQQVIARLGGPLSARWSDVTATASRFGSDDDTLAIEPADLNAVLECLKRDPPALDDAVRLMEAWRREPARKALARLADGARVLSGRLEKDVDVVVAVDGDLRMDERFSDLWSALVHVVSNAVDHGIEDAEARAATQKPARSHVRLAARMVDHKVVVEISDDGRGIDWEALAARGKERGMPTATAAERTAILFADGVSTKTTASTISGRGVGLAAARAACERLGGTIEVESVVGAGATFRFVLPAEGVSA